MSTAEASPLLLHGIGIGERCAYAPLVFFARRTHAPTECQGQGIDAERARLRVAIEAVGARLSELARTTRESVGDGEAEIFEIHAMLLSDADLLEAIDAELLSDVCAEVAVKRAAALHAERLCALGDAYLSERARDLEDLSGQLIDALAGESRAMALPQEGGSFLLVADDLLPSETVTLDRSRICGFVMMSGSPTSHTAILSKAMGIPALVGVGAIDPAYEGCAALLDAREGTLTVHPDDARVEAALARQRETDFVAEAQRRELLKLADRPAVTLGGRRMLVYANVGDVHEARAAEENGADGIGLLRSELLYLSKDRYPTEEELTECYGEIANDARGKRIVIRTLDVGADKQASYFSLPQEENPALGFRGVRVCLARRELFKTQLRAILRASAHARISLMLPMIVSVEEVRQSKALLAECMEELEHAGIPYEKHLEVGIMIETPAAAIMSEELAREVDFFSVGTNDLTQYTLAADRQNPLVAHICDANREPILRLIEHAAGAIHKRGGWIGICGELAADFRLTQRFADMGVDELSVSVPYLLGLRRRITECQ